MCVCVCVCMQWEGELWMAIGGRSRSEMLPSSYASNLSKAVAFQFLMVTYSKEYSLYSLARYTGF